MAIHKIQRQKLLSEPFSLDALKLSRALYYTYLNNDKELYMEVKLKTIYSLLKLIQSKESLAYVEQILDELNEPIAVKNFKFYAKTYTIRFIIFCKYKVNGDMMEIELNEEYLHAEKEYMMEQFLSN